MDRRIHFKKFHSWVIHKCFSLEYSASPFYRTWSTRIIEDWVEDWIQIKADGTVDIVNRVQPRPSLARAGDHCGLMRELWQKRWQNFSKMFNEDSTKIVSHWKLMLDWCDFGENTHFKGNVFCLLEIICLRQIRKWRWIWENTLTNILNMEISIDDQIHKEIASVFRFEQVLFISNIHQISSQMNRKIRSE